MTHGPYSEAETRRQRIDRTFARAGWKVDDPTQVIQDLDIYLRQDRNPTNHGATASRAIPMGSPTER